MENQTVLAAQEKGGTLEASKIRNIVYANICRLCKEQGKNTSYIGESSRTMLVRSSEHQQDCFDSNKPSHMRLHMGQEHPEAMSAVLDSFQMVKIKACASALSRQVREAVEIAEDRSHCLLNSKEEYNRCVLPSIRVEGPPAAKVQQTLEPPSKASPESTRGGASTGPG